MAIAINFVRLTGGVFILTLTVAALTLGAVFTVPEAAAQEDSGGFMLEEVIVTAQKRTQSLQDVPISVNAFSEEQIGELGLRNINDIANYTPGLSVRTTTAGVMPKITIRGVGVSSDLVFSQTPQSTAIHVDEVFYGSPIVLLLGQFDTKHIEVLKGPQGTLFGRNTTAGSVNYITNKPEGEFGSGIEIGQFFYETQGSYSDIQGYITGPITENLNGRFAFIRTRGDDFVRDLENRPYNGPDVLSGRAMLSWAASDDLDILFTVRAGKDQTASKVGQAFLVADAPGQNCGWESLDEPSQDLINCAPTRSFDGPVVQEDNSVIDFTAPPGIYNNDVYKNGYQDGSPPKNSVKFSGVTLRADWSISDFDLVSITAFDDATVARTDNFIYRPTGTERSYVEFYDEDITQLSQEIRFSYIMDSFSWMFGLYYFNEEIDHNRLGHFAGEQTQQEDWRTDMISNHEAESYAIFTDGEFFFNDRFSVVGGVRFTEEKKSYKRLVRYNFLRDVRFDVLDTTFVWTGAPNPITGDIPDRYVRQEVCPCSKTWDNVDWRIGLNFRPTENVLLYGLVADGFKGGLYSGSSLIFPQQLSNPADPEELTSYEIGVKSELLDNSLRFNASAFFYDYTDLQVQATVGDPTGGQTSIFTNAPETEIYGLDMDILWAPTSQLLFTIAISLIEGEYTDVAITDPFTGNVQDFSGSDIIDAPELSMTSAVRYEWSSDSVIMSIGGEVVYLGETDFSFRDAEATLGDFNRQAMKREPVTTANVRFNIEMNNGVGVSFFVNNFTDEEVLRDIRRSREAFTANYNAPRTYGVRLITEF